MVRAFGSEEDHMSLIDVAAPLAEKVQLAIFQAEGVSAQGTSAPLETDLHALIDRLRATFNQPSDATALHGPARALYPDPAKAGRLPGHPFLPTPLRSWIVLP